MKKYAFLLILYSFTLTLMNGCSSTKLANSYKSDDFETIRGKKVLVISRTPLEDIRRTYENQITKELKRKGIDAMASHIAFPSLERVTNKTTDKVANIIAMFRKEGYDILLLTSLKNIQEQEILRRESGYNSLPQYYGNEYLTLKGYYDDVNAPPKLPPLEQPPVTNIQKATTYILEAVTYNLTLEEDQRLLSVITTEVTNPDSGLSVRKGFGKIIASQLK